MSSSEYFSGDKKLVPVPKGGIKYCKINFQYTSILRYSLYIIFLFFLPLQLCLLDAGSQCCCFLTIIFVDKANIMVPMLCNGVIVLHVFYGVIESIKFILNITVGGLFYILVL